MSAQNKKARGPSFARGRRVPFVTQLTPTDCGVACLSAVLTFHGKEIPTNSVRNYLGGGRNGVTARQILIAARELGLRARGVSITPEKLRFLPCGSVLHWELNHFVVFERLTRSGIEVMDPGVGRRHVDHATVNQALSGVALVFEPGEDFVPERRSQGYSALDRTIAARWVERVAPERWSATTSLKFASNMLSTAAEAGIIKGRKDPRQLTVVAVPDAAIGYALYLLRTVDYAGTLSENPYLRSLGIDGGLFPLALARVPGIRYRALGGVHEVDWRYPSLAEWGTDNLGASA